MSYFIQGDNFDKAGGEAEEIVWKQVKESFAQRDVLGYSKYPFFKMLGGKRREPDILLLDREEGLIIFEVKGIFCEDIEKIEGNQWILKSGYAKSINPIDQVDDYVYSLLNTKFESERILRGKVKARGIVVFPYITKKEWEASGFNKVTTNFPIVFKDDLTKVQFLRKCLEFQPLRMGSGFDDESFKLAKSILGDEGVHIDESDDYLPEGTKGRLFSELKRILYELDCQQESIGKTIPPGPQRIRGIAGSGKTLLLCQKAAYMHLKYPDWKIAFVFATQSLYDIVTQTIDMYLRAFSSGEVSYKEGSNLYILHAWGRQDKPGFYRMIAEQNGLRPLNVSDVKRGLNKSYAPQSQSVNYIAKSLLEVCNGNLEQIFDAVLIDEGQDLISTPDLMYQGRHPFYYMTYQSLKYHDVDGKKIKRLIWAYDELQNLDSKVIPSWKEIIGDDHSMGDGPTYKGGINKSEVMKKCYRVPHGILPIAHGLGMGWFRQDGMLTGYTRKEHWESIGYKVLSGDFRKVGSEIVITRDERYSLNPIGDIYNQSLIQFQTFSSQHLMFTALANEVKDDLTKQGLRSQRDILIINLKDKDFGGVYQKELCSYLREQNIDFYIPSSSRLNSMERSSSHADIFWMDGGVTVSKIIRAKGNEAPMVYVVGLEEIGQNEGNSEARNKLFVALTRTKCLVTLMGVGNWRLYDEIETALQSKGIFTIRYNRPKNVIDDADVEA